MNPLSVLKMIFINFNIILRQYCSTPVCCFFSVSIQIVSNFKNSMIYTVLQVEKHSYINYSLQCKNIIFHFKSFILCTLQSIQNNFISQHFNNFVKYLPKIYFKVIFFIFMVNLMILLFKYMNIAIKDQFFSENITQYFLYKSTEIELEFSFNKMLPAQCLHIKQRQHQW